MSLSASLLQSLSRVVGHSHIKQGIVLGLVAKEHVYIEGPPGVAKTMLAETMAAATRLEFYFYQMHRDTRLSELIGEAVVVRSQGKCWWPTRAGPLTALLTRRRDWW